MCVCSCVCKLFTCWQSSSVEDYQEPARKKAVHSREPSVSSQIPAALKDPHTSSHFEFDSNVNRDSPTPGMVNVEEIALDLFRPIPINKK